MRRFLQFLLLAGFALAPLIPASSAEGRQKNRTSHVVTGTWGGEHIVLEASDNGAKVEFDCAHGEITQPLAPDQQGNFDVSGTFTAEHGGPVRRDETPNSSAVRYAGHLQGESMALSITRGEEKLGSFTLTRDAHPLLTKCR
ncbi:MAG TPA: hypothetical protein VKT33_14180 [Candidatus Angelobacter sp.]|nr:hypothetical protein [Candidatus Angelobacter sp.]